MGLTIHYSLNLPKQTSEKAVKAKLEALRQKCLDLPFKEVGSMVDLNAGQLDALYEKKDDPLRWFAIQCGKYADYHYDLEGNLVAGDAKGGTYSRGFNPLRVLGFSTWPGEGCEQANLGLCLYPKTIEIPAQPERGLQGGTVKTPSSLRSWAWRSFCKTEYANEPECGGMPNFFRCHLTVVAMLDAAKELGFKVEVTDEGEFWEKRDVKALAAEVGSWDKMIASFAGALKDASGGGGVASAMDGRSDFERLEAAGVSDPETAKNAAALAKLFAGARKV